MTPRDYLGPPFLDELTAVPSGSPDIIHSGYTHGWTWGAGVSTHWHHGRRGGRALLYYHTPQLTVGAWRLSQILYCIWSEAGTCYSIPVSCGVRTALVDPASHIPVHVPVRTQPSSGSTFWLHVSQFIRDIHTTE